MTTEKKWKCIVWDLDNTLWDGILIEDGPNAIQIRQTVINLIRDTDQGGYCIRSPARTTARMPWRFCAITGWPSTSYTPK